MEIFQTFAEISIGILGFTAIVIMFKSQYANWNNHVYEGMIGHCIQVLFYSILPFILIAYHCKPSTVWTVGSIALGLITLLQGIGVMIVDRVTKLSSKLFLLFFSIIIALIQFLNVFGIFTQQEEGPYIVGITWHIMQALVIFTMIVTKKTDGDKPVP